MPENDQNQIPGGPAINPKNAPKPQEEEPREDLDNEDSQDDGSQQEQQSAAMSIENVKNKADQAKKFVEMIQKTRKAVTAAAKIVKIYLAVIGGSPILIGIIAVVIIIVIIAVSMPVVFRADKGYYGTQSPESLEIQSSETNYDLSMVLGKSVVVAGHGSPDSWYFNQGDPNWKEPGYNPAEYGWPRGKTFKRSGCGITSLAMIAVYYGVNTNPVKTGKYYIDNKGSLLVAPALLPSYIKTETGNARTTYGVARNFESIKKEVEAGNPMLAKIGRGKWGTKGESHFVVIIGVGKDGKHLVINDPAFGRGQPARYVEGSMTGIEKIFAYHDK